MQVKEGLVLLMTSQIGAIWRKYIAVVCNQMYLRWWFGPSEEVPWEEDTQTRR